METVLKTVGRVTTRLVGSNPTPSADLQKCPLTCGDAPRSVGRAGGAVSGWVRPSTAKYGCQCLSSA